VPPTRIPSLAVSLWKTFHLLANTYKGVSNSLQIHHFYPKFYNKINDIFSL